MNRKYLEDIMPKESIFGYHYSSDVRHERWCRQEEEYGFCDIETWDLDKAFAQIIYERLMMYKEVCSDKVELNREIYDANGASYNLEELLDKTISKCKEVILATFSDEYCELMDFVWWSMGVMHVYLWW